MLKELKGVCKSRRRSPGKDCPVAVVCYKIEDDAIVGQGPCQLAETIPLELCRSC